VELHHDVHDADHRQLACGGCKAIPAGLGVCTNGRL